MLWTTFMLEMLCHREHMHNNKQNEMYFSRYLFYASTNDIDCYAGFTSKPKVKTSKQHKITA